jgi:hypothetical protein
MRLVKAKTISVALFRSKSTRAMVRQLQVQDPCGQKDNSTKYEYFRVRVLEYKYAVDTSVVAPSREGCRVTSDERALRGSSSDTDHRPASTGTCTTVVVKEAQGETRCRTETDNCHATRAARLRVYQRPFSLPASRHATSDARLNGDGERSPPQLR